MKTVLLVFWLFCTLLACSSSDDKSKQVSQPEAPIYGHQVVEKIDQPAQGTVRMAFLVNPDTIKRHGAQNVLLVLIGQKCESPCFADLWDNEQAFQLNGETPYSKRTEKWLRKHYVSIADHLVSSKITANSDEIINYPLTYDSRYKRWGGKLKH